MTDVKARYRVAIWLVLTLWTLGDSTSRPAVAADPPALRVRAVTDSNVDRALLERARDVAGRLLQEAGITTSWSLCDASHPCETSGDERPDVVVILTSRKRPLGHQECGVAVGAGASRGTAVVSVPCMADWVFDLSRMRPSDTEPLLAIPRHDDVVGAAVAHEIGHIFGLRHTSQGLMRATLRPVDVVDLRRGRLRFSPREAARLRASVQSAQAKRHAAILAP